MLTKAIVGIFIQAPITAAGDVAEAPKFNCVPKYTKSSTIGMLYIYGP